MKDNKTDKMKELKQFLEKKGEKVENIKYIGTINQKTKNTKKEGKETTDLIDINEDTEEKDIFLCEEKIKDKGGREIILIKYYTEDFECIAVEDKINGILPTEKYRKEVIIEKIEELDKEGIIDLEEETLKETKEIAEILGVEEKDIENIAEIEMEKFKNQQQKEELGNIKDIDAKNLTSVNANEKITTRDSMATLLGVEGKGYTKIAIVKSKELNNTKNTTEFSFVGIKADGKMEQIDSLQQKEGNNPTKTINAISADGKDIKEETAVSKYVIKDREDEELSIRLDELNTIRVSFVRRSPETNESISIPIEANTIVKTSYKDKELMDSIKNPQVTAETKKIQKSKEINEDINIQNEQKNSIEFEEYIPNTDIKWADFAAQCGYRGEGAIEKAKKVFEEAKENSGLADNEEIAKNTVKTKEEDYRPDIMQQN